MISYMSSGTMVCVFMDNREPFSWYTIQIPRVQNIHVQCFLWFHSFAVEYHMPLLASWVHQRTTASGAPSRRLRSRPKSSKRLQQWTGESVRRYGVHYSWKLTSHIWLDPSPGKISYIQIWYPIVSKYDLYINWYKCVTIVTIVSQLYVQVPASFFTFKFHKIIPKKSTTNSPSSRCLRPRQKCSMVS